MQRKKIHLCFSIIFPGFMDLPDVWQNHQVWHPGQQPWCILNPILFLTLLLSDGTHLLGWHPTRALGWLKRETFWGIKLVNQESDGWVKIVVIDFYCFPFLLDFPSVNRSKFIEHALEFVGTWCMLDRRTMWNLGSYWSEGTPAYPTNNCNQTTWFT